jgi:hypothetical protein
MEGEAGTAKSDSAKMLKCGTDRRGLEHPYCGESGAFNVYIHGIPMASSWYSRYPIIVS